MGESTRAFLDRLGNMVAAAWGEGARYDLEMRTGLLPELVAARDALGEKWAGVLAEFLSAKTPPRSVGAGLLAHMRRRAREPASRPTAREVVRGLSAARPSAELTPYHRALLGLMTCDPTAKMQ